MVNYTKLSAYVHTCRRNHTAIILFNSSMLYSTKYVTRVFFQRRNIRHAALTLITFSFYPSFFANLLTNSYFPVPCHCIASSVDMCASSCNVVVGTIDISPHAVTRRHATPMQPEVGIYPSLFPSRNGERLTPFSSSFPSCFARPPSDAACLGPSTSRVAARDAQNRQTDRQTHTHTHTHTHVGGCAWHLCASVSRWSGVEWSVIGVCMLGVCLAHTTIKQENGDALPVMHECDRHAIAHVDGDIGIN